jgi:hypothetical protein
MIISSLLNDATALRLCIDRIAPVRKGTAARIRTSED